MIISTDRLYTLEQNFASEQNQDKGDGTRGLSHVGLELRELSPHQYAGGNKDPEASSAACRGVDGGDTNSCCIEHPIFFSEGLCFAGIAAL